MTRQPHMTITSRLDDQLRLLPSAYRPLLNKFYRAHRSPMRVPPGAACWVAGSSEIVAALCLSPVEHGHWLTGLLVAPEQRNKGLAARLVTHALEKNSGPVWLFCAPELIPFYRRLDPQLPDPLSARLQRYNRHKTLVALGRP